MSRRIAAWKFSLGSSKNNPHPKAPEDRRNLLTQPRLDLRKVTELEPSLVHAINTNWLW